MEEACSLLGFQARTHFGHRISANQYIFCPYNHLIYRILSASAENNSYKYHGYRTLCIWFHGVESQDTPVRGLYEALVSIGRRKLADKIRRELDSDSGTTKMSSSCVINWIIMTSSFYPEQVSTSQGFVGLWGWIMGELSVNWELS